jgi:hypothetical protein
VYILLRNKKELCKLVVMYGFMCALASDEEYQSIYAILSSYTHTISVTSSKERSLAMCFRRTFIHDHVSRSQAIDVIKALLSSSFIQYQRPIFPSYMYSYVIMSNYDARRKASIYTQQYLFCFADVAFCVEASFHVVK